MKQRNEKYSLKKSQKNVLNNSKDNDNIYKEEYDYCSEDLFGPNYKCVYSILLLIINDMSNIKTVKQS